jgi:hypothetical protein
MFVRGFSMREVRDFLINSHYSHPTVLKISKKAYELYYAEAETNKKAAKVEKISSLLKSMGASDEKISE